MINATSAFLTANAALAKQPIYIFTIAGYTRVFTNYATGISGQYDWIEDIADLGISISDLDGGSDLGELDITVTDTTALITADFPGFVFEGKAVTLQTGFPGMSQADFVTLFTGIVDSVASANLGNSYVFKCTDNKQILTKVIYTLGDDGKPTDSNNPRTLNGHPLDILLTALTNELGLNYHGVNMPSIMGYRDSLFAGLQFTFSITTPPAAKDFLEQQILKPLGGYLWTNNLGQIDVVFFASSSGPAICAGCLVGAFADVTGQLVMAPFAAGLRATLDVPPGATQLLLGVNDNPYVDNSGSWKVNVTGVGDLTVLGTAAPWTFSGGINAAYPFLNAGSSAPTAAAVTAGTTITIAYVSGLCSIHLLTDLHDTLGLPPALSNASSPGIYCHPVPRANTGVLVLNVDNTAEIPDASQADLIDTLSFRFDKDASGNFVSQLVQSYTPSIVKYGLVGQHIIESDGMHSALQGFFVAALTARLIFLRYGTKNLAFGLGSASAGTPLIAFWTACVIEPGDIVAVTNPFIPDRVAGVKGITAKLFEVLDRVWNFNEGKVTLTLLDSGIATFKLAYIAPGSTPVFTSASSYQKNRYMFLCNNSDQQSDGTSAQVLA